MPGMTAATQPVERARAATAPETFGRTISAPEKGNVISDLETEFPMPQGTRFPGMRTFFLTPTKKYNCVVWSVKTIKIDMFYERSCCVNMRRNDRQLHVSWEGIRGSRIKSGTPEMRQVYLVFKVHFFYVCCSSCFVRVTH